MSNLFGGTAASGMDVERQLSLLSLVEDSADRRPGLAVVEASETETHADPETERAEKRYRRLLARKERLGDFSGMAACYIRLGDIFLARGDSEEAGEMYRKSLKLARAANSASKGVAPRDLL